MAATELHNEKELLVQVAKGNETAFAELFHFYQPHVFSIALRFTKSKAQSEDIVQEVFTRLWLNHATLADIEHFRAYLYTLTRNLVYNLLKRQAKEELILLELSIDYAARLIDPADSFTPGEWKGLLERLISRLPSQQQRVFRMGKLEGLKHEEIADALKISPETVKKHMMEAVRTIRVRLRPEEGLLVCWLIAQGIQ